MQNFVQFHAIESNIELSQKFWEKLNTSAPYWAIYIQIASLLFLLIYILCINFCSISSSRNQDQRIPKISENVKLPRHLLSDFHQKLIVINLCLDNTTYKNFIKFCWLYLERLPQSFCHAHTQTHRHIDRFFPKIVKSYKEHPKTRKSIKTRKSKICWKPIFSSI